MKIFLIVNFIILSLIGYSQTEVTRIPIKTKNAYDIYEKTNKEGNHSFFFDLYDKYLFVITDSLFNVIYEKKDPYYVSSPHISLAGTIVTDTSFIYFFKRNIDNELMVISVDFKNKTVFRKKVLKVFPASYKIRKYINTKNRLFLLTTSKRDNNIAFFEVTAALEVIKHEFNTDEKNVQQFLKKGFFHYYYLDDSQFSFLVRYIPFNKSKPIFTAYKFDLKSKRLYHHSFDINSLHTGANKHNNDCYLSGALTDSLVYIAAIKASDGLMLINSYSYFSEKPQKHVSFNLLESLTTSENYPYIVDYTSHSYKKANKDDIIKYFEEPFSLWVNNYKTDTAFASVSFINMYYFQKKLYDLRMDISLTLNNPSLSLIEIIKPIDEKSIQVIHNAFTSINTEYYADPLGGTPSYEIFNRNKNELFIGIIESKTKEFVIYSISDSLVK